MRVGSKNWVLFKFIPYEYKALERYLEKMALRGWMLEDVSGYFLKFTKIEPKALKYSVDIMDKISMFVGSDSKSAVECREYCEAAGWKFVAQMEKMQIYCSDSEVENIPIQTDEEEKYNSILKASLKYGVINLMCVAILSYSQYTTSFGNIYNEFLADNYRLILLLLFSLWLIQDTVQFIHIIIWAIKGRLSLKRHEEVSYDFKLMTNIKLALNKMIVITTVVILCSMIFSGLFEEHLVKVLIVVAVSIIIGVILFKITKKIIPKDKMKKLVNILVVVIIVAINAMVFSKMTVHIGTTGTLGANNKYDENYTLRIEDFNCKSIDRYADKNKSILASYEHYYEDGNEDSYISYYLYRSKYEFIIDYILNKEFKSMDKYEEEVIEIENNISDNIKVYKSIDRNKFILVSDNIFISLYINKKDLDDEEVISIIYYKVFKSAS